MRVLELWRYPVKSMQGERLEVAEAGPDGLVGDRGWALFDQATGLGLTARRVPDLLFAAGRLRPDGAAEVVLPGGAATTDDAVLSDWLGRPVALRQAGSVAAPHYESPDDDELSDPPGWHEWQGAGGPFHDIATARISLVTTGTLGTWDRRRFRANVVLDGSGENALGGALVRLGGAVLEVNDPIARCVMVTRPQSGGIGRDTSVLKTIHRQHGGDLAMGAQVRTPGTVRTGDELVPG